MHEDYAGLSARRRSNYPLAVMLALTAFTAAAVRQMAAPRALLAACALTLNGAALAFRPPVAMLELNRAAASVAMPVVAAGLIAAAGAMPAHAAVKPSTGEQVFQGNCAACHAGGQNVIMPQKTLEATALLEYLDGGYNEEAVVKQVSNGKGAMPAFGYLSDMDIASVITYTRNSWGNDAGVVTPADVAAQR